MNCVKVSEFVLHFPARIIMGIPMLISDIQLPILDVDLAVQVE